MVPRAATNLTLKRSKVKVKVTAWCQLKGLVTRIMHAKYQCSTINTQKDMSQVKVFVTDRRTDEWVLMSPAFAKARGTTMGPNPWPLWLLVGTASAFGPELIYRLHVAQPTLMDITRYFWYTIILLVLYIFVYLSALVSCWSWLVSMRRVFFYKFLNVCPFDNTAVAVSGKVEGS